MHNCDILSTPYFDVMYLLIVLIFYFICVVFKQIHVNNMKSNTYSKTHIL